MDGILQIGISRNTKCDNTVGFVKSGHIFRVYTVYAYSHMWVTGYDIISCNYIVTMVVKQIKKIN